MTLEPHGPSLRLARMFVVLWLGTAALLLTSSVTTLVTTLQARPSNPHVALLASLEAIAAVTFALPRYTRLGAVALVSTLLVAFCAHALIAQFRFDLVLFALVVSFVGVHGPLSAARVDVVSVLHRPKP